MKEKKYSFSCYEHFEEFFISPLFILYSGLDEGYYDCWSYFWMTGTGHTALNGSMDKTGRRTLMFIMHIMTNK